MSADQSDRTAPVLRALELIEELDPLRFARIAHQMPDVMVRDGGVPHYAVETGLCIVDSKTVERKTRAYLALVLVHEATHARLNAAGFLPWRSIRPRLERRCLREEISFCLRLQHAGWGGTEEVRRSLSERIQALEGAMPRN